MKSAITICLVPQASAGPFVYHTTLADGCARAAELGFDAVEIFPPSANGIDIADLQGLLDHHDLKVAAVGSGAGWLLHRLSLTSPDAKIRHDAREFIAAIIDLAGGFDAPAILGSMQGRVEEGVPREQALAWLGEALDDLGERAAAHHVPFLYEPLNRYETNLFNRQHEAATWLATLRTRNVRLLCDLFHMAIEEVHLGATLQGLGSAVGHVHFADSNRHAIGLGHTNPAPIIAALKAIGYDGYLSAEVLPQPNAETAAQTTIESFRKLVL
jgi:sugar phosphate isomerase/epimerase